MKIVSFKVAKALNEAGYPQATEYWYSKDGELCYSLSDLDELGYISCPTYLSTWLWLWREKKKWIDVSFSLDEDNWTFMQDPSPCDCGLYTDPEEAIIAAIEYLVENKLLK